MKKKQTIRKKKAPIKKKSTQEKVIFEHSKKAEKTQKRKSLQWKLPSLPDFPKLPSFSFAKRVRRFPHDILLLVIPVCLLVILFSINSLNETISKQIDATKLPHEAVNITLAPYPMFLQTFTPYISANAALIMEDKSKVVLYERNADLRFSMASTTKIMTALVALEYFRFDDVLTINRENVEGAKVGFKKGDSVFFEDLLYGMMLPSGNDAAYAIADNYPGGHEAFISRMNEKAKELGLSHTHFADAAGLNDDGNYTTAWDLAYMASEALQNKTIAKVASTKRRIISNASNTEDYDIYNLNKLLGVNGVIGIKTGYTEGAGGVLVTAKEEGKSKNRFIIVVMKSQDRFLDTQTLLTLISDNITYFTPVYSLSN
jgi:D-alanyl-D-alanine carboxypeptidase